ncbi:MAG: ABC-2 type transport system permease protein, partial [Maribacter sp.]
MNKKLKNSLFLIISLIAINVTNQSFYQRFDLTEDQRYTL